MQEKWSIASNEDKTMFEIIRNFFRRAGNAPGQAERFDLRCDPLSHPVLRRMTPDQLADLPLGRTRFADDRNGPCGEDERFYA